MNDVLFKKLSYANVANPPAPMQNTTKRVVPGESIPVTDPHYLPPGSLLRNMQPLGPSLDRSKSVGKALYRTVVNIVDNPNSHDSAVSHDRAETDNDNTGASPGFGRGGPRIFFQIWKFACRFPSLGGSGTCPHEKIF